LYPGLGDKLFKILRGNIIAKDDANVETVDVRLQKFLTELAAHLYIVFHSLLHYGWIGFSVTPIDCNADIIRIFTPLTTCIPNHFFVVQIALDPNRASLKR